MTNPYRCRRCSQKRLSAEAVRVGGNKILCIKGGNGKPLIAGEFIARVQSSLLEGR
jgi:hypothetical protein